MENVKDQISRARENDVRTIVESPALWNDPTRNRKPSIAKTAEQLHHWRTHYQLERRRDHLLNVSNESCTDSHTGAKGAFPCNPPKPMPPEFQLMYPRRVRWSSWYTLPDWSGMHLSGARDATPEEEAWHRINDPERGLHPDDLAAFRESKRGPLARFFARLKFCPSKVTAN